MIVSYQRVCTEYLFEVIRQTLHITVCEKFFEQTSKLQWKSSASRTTVLFPLDINFDYRKDRAIELK